MTSNSPQHFIAIGASAGGFEELNTFFDFTPLDSVAYVIVQHLSPDFKSHMVQLLAKHSQLLVKEAEEGTLVIRNCVYLIPNNKFMTIRNGALHLTDKKETGIPHLTVNTFFNSLAADCGSKAIGIILSGLGSDGTEGIKAIKKAGGMVMARQPETTQFGSMPASAIATGLVDFVLEPEQMPEAIREYALNAEEMMTSAKEDERIQADILELIRQTSPLDFSDYKPSTIGRRIKRRAVNLHFTRLENYLEFLKTNPEEVSALSRDFLISVTGFFRDKEAFRFIEEDTIPQLLANLPPGNELKLWVAGCATGEEAYSFAMIICEQIRGTYKDTPVKIFATDLDAIALAHASRGVYDASIEKDVSAERLQKHFIKEGESYRVNQDIRNMVIFAQHDLSKNPPFCNMDLISCRNLLIYMSPTLQKRIFNMLLFGLKFNGYLFLGASETPAPIMQSLEQLPNPWKIYRNIETRRTVHFDGLTVPELKPSSSLASYTQPPQSSGHALPDAIADVLVTDLDCVAICVDENGQFLKAYGDTSKYLLQKNFTLHLPDLLPKPLAIAFEALRKSALSTGIKQTIRAIPVTYHQQTVHVMLSVTALNTKKEKQNLLLITLCEDRVQAPLPQEVSVFDEQKYHDQHIINLEEELRDLKEKLHDAYAKLDATNENLQSFNEELLSTNEEMQSTNEEMQSVNEELHTINVDYQLKNKELQELNDDLNNYFRSNVNGQLFINNTLHLMKFSPAAVKLFNLLPTDVGRPLSHISTNVKLDTFAEDIQQVLQAGSVITREVETNSGTWYQVMTMPYIQQSDNSIKGAVLTFNDITELKKAQTELNKKNESLQRINNDLDNFVYTTSHDLLAPLNNIEISLSMMGEVAAGNRELKPMLAITKASITKFRALITQISYIAKVESEMKSLDWVNIEEITSNVEWSLSNKMQESGAVIHRNFGVSQIWFSPKNLRSIVYNLISNAIKFRGEAAPVVFISTVQQGDYILLQVQDNGIGIAAPDIEKIFGIYSRLSNNVEGTGIGLHLIKKIVDAAGGSINVESEVGTGTTFRILLKSNSTF